MRFNIALSSIATVLSAKITATCYFVHIVQPYRAVDLDSCLYYMHRQHRPPMPSRDEVKRVGVQRSPAPVVPAYVEQRGERHDARIPISLQLFGRCEGSHLCWGVGWGDDECNGDVLIRH